jgi:transposase-like protein
MGYSSCSCTCSSSCSKAEGGVSSNLWTGVKYDLTVSEKREKKQRRLRRYYDEEFKRNAVEMLETGERSAVQLAQELGVSDCSLGTWKRLYGKEASAKRSPAGEQQARIRSSKMSKLQTQA